MIPEKHFAVAVDGPSGAGKSTLAKAIAAKLGILYVDTGAIYRTIGYAVKRRGIEPRDEAAVRAILPELEIGMRYEADGEQHMLLNGQDVTREIRLPEISMYARAVSGRTVGERRVGAAVGARVPAGNAARSGAEAQRHYGRA